VAVGVVSHVNAGIAEAAGESGEVGLRGHFDGEMAQPRGARRRRPLVADDCIHGHSFWPGATIFPTQLGMASTWDADLIEQGARVTAVEVAATGIHWVFSPVL